VPGSEPVYRPGYAPDNVAVGYRGLGTRRRILECAGRLFVARGYHGTSIDAIAEEVGSSRAAIYQYFHSKDDIFGELYRQCEPDVLAHGRRLGRLAPDADGLRNLHQWLLEWADMYDRYAMVFLELPGIGPVEGSPQIDAGRISVEYAATISAKLHDAGVCGIEPDDAADVLIRIVHMVNLYRFRAMFGLCSSTRTSASLAIALQLLLFPETPDEVLETVAAPPMPDAGPRTAPEVTDAVVAQADPGAGPPVRQEILVAASALFFAHGYHSTSMRDIAAAADTSRATLYRYFSTKVAILAELSDQAIAKGRSLADELRALAHTGIGAESLQDWLTRFVTFQRAYAGVTRTWYDGTLAQQLPVDRYRAGNESFHRATVTLVERVQLPAGLDMTVSAAVFLAVLGRLTDLSLSHHPERNDADTAALMMTVLRRTLLRAAFTPPG